MTDQLLGVLKIALLALLYLFFARVLWTVWVEVRGAPVGAVQRSGAAAPPRGRRKAVGRLVVLEPAERRGDAVAVLPEMTVGRSEGCTVAIPSDTFMSQVHVRLFVSDGTLHVEDLGSTNGSYLNGNRFQGTVTVRKGDRIQVGNTVLEAQ